MPAQGTAPAAVTSSVSQVFCDALTGPGENLNVFGIVQSAFTCAGFGLRFLQHPGHEYIVVLDIVDDFLKVKVMGLQQIVYMPIAAYPAAF